MGLHKERKSIPLRLTTTNPSKTFYFYCRMKFLGVISKYFNSEWSVSKIKISEDLKTVAFDTKNNRVTVITYNRLIFSFPIPD